MYGIVDFLRNVLVNTTTAYTTITNLKFSVKV